MKRFIILATLASVLSLATATAGPAETAGSVKPACADITDASAFFSSTGTEVSGGITGLADISCKSVRYAMVVYVYDDATHQVSQILSQTLRGDNTHTHVGSFDINFTPAAQYVCVYFTSQKGDLDKQQQPLDTAPDTGCPATLDTSLFNTVAAGTSPGGQGYF